MRFRIRGGKKLEGTLEVSGSKNAATPLLAATILAGEPCRIRNIPRIRDVERMIELLQLLGSEIRWEDDHTVVVDTRNVSIEALESPQAQKAVKSMRSSVLLLGPLLARFGVLTIPEPGGCIIGRRPLDTHMAGMAALGADIKHEHGIYRIACDQLTGSTIILPELSVTATENVVMASVRARGRTILRMAATEPHVVQLCTVLSSMGANIHGIGSHTLVIDGVATLKGFDVAVIPDDIEAITFALAAILTNSTIAVAPISYETTYYILFILRSLGAHLDVTDDTLTVSPPHALRGFKIKTLPSPGFPTDLQAPFGVLATQCIGASLIHDPLYEGRLGYIQELIKMGANAVVCDPHRVIVTGPTPLYGTDIRSFDLRAGATLVLAGLIAQGETVIHDAELVYRGYERLDERLRAVGADIVREE